jgi:hypothetical protein
MIDKRGKELLARLRESTPEAPIEMDKSVIIERDTYRRALEKIQHIIRHLSTLPPKDQLVNISAIVEKALKT